MVLLEPALLALFRGSSSDVPRPVNGLRVMRGRPEDSDRPVAYAMEQAEPPCIQSITGCWKTGTLSMSKSPMKA